MVFRIGRRGKSLAITLKDVAARAGVSRSAVSRTFTDGASVSRKMREKVETAARELGYRPNALASSLTTGRTKMIGLVSNNFQNPVFLQIFDLFTRGLQECGLRPLLVNLSDEEDPEQSLSMLQQYSVDGVVVASSTLPLAFAEAFEQAGIPVVHAFGGQLSGADVPVIGIDNVESGRLAARVLIERGYNDIGFLGGPEIATSTKDRFLGFKEVLAAHPEIKTRFSFAQDYSFKAGRQSMLEQLCGTPAQAYFCGDDVLAIGAMSAVRDQGLKIPKDIGLLGLNDMEMADWENIALTTIHQPIKEIVMATIETMQQILKNEEAVVTGQVFPCQLVERGTLRPKT